MALLNSLGEALRQSSGIQNPHTGEPDIPTEFITPFISMYDEKPQRNREGGTNGYMHVSNLISLTCKRKSVLMQRHQVEHHERVSSGHHLMWAQGRATESHIREGVIAMREGNGVYGEWSCVCGHSKHRGSRPDQRLLCEKCGHPVNVYGEAVLYDTEYMITGSPDLALMLPRDYLYITEIKSMNPDQFDELERPLPDHINQGVAYRDIFHRQGFKVHSKVSVFYARKEFRWGYGRGKNRVYKEFQVDATSEQSRVMLGQLYETAADVLRFKQQGGTPERTQCTSPESTKAKQCPVAHMCFSQG